MLYVTDEPDLSNPDSPDVVKTVEFHGHLLMCGARGCRVHHPDGSVSKVADFQQGKALVLDRLGFGRG